jgi:hypothetical protein
MCQPYRNGIQLHLVQLVRGRCSHRWRGQKELLKGSRGTVLLLSRGAGRWNARGIIFRSLQDFTELCSCRTTIRENIHMSLDLDFQAAHHKHLAASDRTYGGDSSIPKSAFSSYPARARNSNMKMACGRSTCRV